MNPIYHLNKLKGKDIFNILDENRDGIDDYFWNYYKNFSTEKLEKYVFDICDFLKPCGKVLSIGCGHGLNELFMADMCKEVETILGVDIVKDKIASMNAIADKLDFQNVKGIVGDGTKIYLPNGSFDSVIIIESLSHVENQYIALKEALRVLKKGGWLFVLDFNNGANPKVLYGCWKDNRSKGVIDESPVNPYFLRNRLLSHNMKEIQILPYRSTPFIKRIGVKFFSEVPKIPIWLHLMFTRGFMLKAKKE